MQLKRLNLIIQTTKASFKQAAFHNFSQIGFSASAIVAVLEIFFPGIGIGMTITAIFSVTAGVFAGLDRLWNVAGPSMKSDHTPAIKSKFKVGMFSKQEYQPIISDDEASDKQLQTERKTTLADFVFS